MKFADLFFLVFHTALVFFNLFGWIYRPTRKTNLVTLLLTGASWFILGIFYGIGYCPLTDWHFEVLRNLGTRDLPDSYLVYLIKRLTNIEADPIITERMTAILYFISLIASLYVNLFRKEKVS